MKKTVVAGLMLISAIAGVRAGELHVEKVTAQQRYPWNGLVDIAVTFNGEQSDVANANCTFAATNSETKVALAIAHVTQQGNDTGSGTTWTRHFVWDTNADVGEVKVDDLELFADVEQVEGHGSEHIEGMVCIPGGTNSGHLRISNSTYSLTVDDFWMDRTEVTYSHWKKVFDWAVAHGYSFYTSGSGKGPNHPVHTIYGFDAAKWCNARSEMEGLPCVYCLSDGMPMRTGRRWSQANLSCGGYRLPKHEEWMYAARGGLQSKLLPRGDTISHENANYRASANNSVYDYRFGTLHIYDVNPISGYHPSYNDGVNPYTAPVGSFAPNGYGLYDMAGNVWEFCTDASGLPFDIEYDGIVIGGSWDGSWGLIIGGEWWNHWSAHDSIGFRCVRR